MKKMSVRQRANHQLQRLCLKLQTWSYRFNLPRLRNRVAFPLLLWLTNTPQTPQYHKEAVE